MLRKRDEGRVGARRQSSGCAGAMRGRCLDESVTLYLSEGGLRKV
jgi:hypothetical protein